MMSSVQFGVREINGNTVVAAGVPVSPPAMVPRPLNIVRSSRTPSDGSARWQNGFSYTPDGIGVAGIGDAACSGEFVQMEETDAATSDWTPYALTASYTCSSFGWSENDYKGRVTRLLEAMTPKLLEWEFWG